MPLQNDQFIWWLNDVYEFLDTQRRQKIYSDPLTSYVLRALTLHSIPEEKFYARTSGEVYTASNIEKTGNSNSKSRLVINRRNGSASKTIRSLNH